MVEIRALNEIALEDLQRLVVGYTSPGRYDIVKVETIDHTQINLQRQLLQSPYQKVFHLDEEMCAIYHRAAASGFSFAAYEGARMIGVALAEAQEWNRSLWVWEFHIAADWRRRGIGRKLMARLVEQAAREDLRLLVCETQNTNLPAIDFYRAVGFAIEGIDLSYYTNQDLLEGEVAIFMKMKLEE